MEAKAFSDVIRNCREGVVRNPYQGNDKKVVFVCSMGILRSATAARLYSARYNCRTAGTWDDALVPLTPLLIAWSDELVFVNEENYKDTLHKYGEKLHDITKVKVLNIPDNYPHMAPELIDAFDKQYEPVPKHWKTEVL